jgi:hypothetical protein
MRIIKKIGAIIALKKEGGQEEVPYIVCPNQNCLKNAREEPFEVQCKNGAQIRGIITCLNCNHEWPITIDNGHIKEIAVALPAVQSDQLHESVPLDIQDDVQEAERANYSQCYKACVTMCRRALQLGLIDREIADGPLSGMLEEAKTLLDEDTYALAKSIKGYGDIGTHRREELNPEEVRMVIYAAVRMLNEIFK